MRIALQLSLIFVLLLAVACSDSSPNGPDKTPELSTPLPNEEAELMAIFVSDSTLAPIPLYNQILSDVTELRARWADSLAVWDDDGGGPYTSVVFWPLCTPSELSLFITDSLHTAIATDQSPAWDALMDSLALDSATFTFYQYRPDTWYGHLYFHGRQSSRLLGNRLIGFPGVTSISMSGGCFDHSLFLPVFTDSTRGYCYDFRWGDCPAGCGMAKSCYFVMNGDSALHVGNYIWEWNDPDRPAWANDILLPAFERHATDWMLWHPDSTSIR
jgi:hypothetical protein